MERVPNRHRTNVAFAYAASALLERNDQKGTLIGRRNMRFRPPVLAGHSRLGSVFSLRRQQAREGHVPVPILELVPVVVLHILDAALDLGRPRLGAGPFDPRCESEPLAPADPD